LVGIDFVNSDVSRPPLNAFAIQVPIGSPPTQVQKCVDIGTFGGVAAAMLDARQASTRFVGSMLAAVDVNP
jgi:hypothetical protein